MQRKRMNFYPFRERELEMENRIEQKAALAVDDWVEYDAAKANANRKKMKCKKRIAGEKTEREREERRKGKGMEVGR